MEPGEQGRPSQRLNGSISEVKTEQYDLYHSVPGWRVILKSGLFDPTLWEIDEDELKNDLPYDEAGKKQLALEVSYHDVPDVFRILAGMYRDQTGVNFTYGVGVRDGPSGILLEPLTREELMQAREQETTSEVILSQEDFKEILEKAGRGTDGSERID